MAIAALVLVYATRLDAAWYSTPFGGHPDENYIVNPTFQTAKTGELNPHFLN